MWRHKCFYTATDSLLSLKPQTSVSVIRLRISLEVPTNSKIRHSYLAWKTKGTTVRRYNWIVSVWKHFPNTFIQTHTALFKWIHPTAPECFLSSPPLFFFFVEMNKMWKPPQKMQSVKRQDDSRRRLDLRRHLINKQNAPLLGDQKQHTHTHTLTS